MTNAAPKVRLGQLLIDQGLLTQQQLADALVVQKSTGRMLGEVLVEKKFITPAILASTLAASAGIKVCQLRHGLIDPALLKLGETLVHFIRERNTGIYEKELLMNSDSVWSMI